MTKVLPRRSPTKDQRPQAKDFPPLFEPGPTRHGEASPGRCGPAIGRGVDMNPTGTVVVGVDGSPASRAAIEFAMREAARRHAWLRVIAAAQLPEYWTIAYGTADLPSPEEVIADTKR